MLFIVPARAEPLNRFDATAMEASVACELYKVAKSLGSKVKAERLHAKLDITGSDVRNIEGSGGFTIPLPFVPVTFGATIRKSNKQSQTFGYHGIRNINVANRPNCSKSFAIPLNVAECILRSDYINGDSVDCSTEVTATAGADANFKVKLWVIDGGPTGSYSVTRTMKVAISAPAPK
jgi:hypothetical protein